MRTVTSIEGDAFPVHETSRGGGGDAHGVVIIDHPGSAFADAAGTVIEANGDGFLGDIFGFDLESPKEHGTEIHLAILGE